MITIADLSYLENTSTIELAELAELVELKGLAELILGSAGVSVLSYGAATGNPTYVGVTANTTAKSFPNGGVIAIGWGTATAIGNDPQAGVAVAGTGDIVVAISNSTSSPKQADAFGFVLAVDLPNILNKWKR